MIRYVLFVGVAFAAAFTFIWLLFTVALQLGNDPTPFTRTGPAFKFWLVCLLIAIVVDAVMRPAARAAVSAFAASLTPEACEGTCEVRQSSRLDAGIRTSTSGYFQGRRTTVLVDQTGRFSFLNLEMDCRAPWLLEIRKRNLASRALGFVGLPIRTGDKALDAVVVVQGDDEAAIRQWTCSSEVKPRILSLFEVCGITFLATGTVLRAQYARFRPRLFALAHATLILNHLGYLAAYAEAASAQRLSRPSTADPEA